LQRLQWVHCGERPQPAITQQIKALEGGHSRQLVTLRDPSGRPMCERAGPANVAVGHYARVSRQPVVDAAAKAEVLAAVRAEQPAASEDADGSQSVWRWVRLQQPWCLLGLAQHQVRTAFL
jgi:hypothetical protein